MAVTDNRTQLQDCEAVGDVAGDSTADPQSNTSEAGVVIQGTNALQFQVTNAQEYLAYDLDSAGSTFNLDLSDSTVYIMIKDNLHDSFANLGGQITLDDTADGVSTTTIGYAVAGYDVIGLPYEKKYSAMKLDVSVVVASPGTSGVDFFQHNGTEANLDQTIIKQVGYGSIHLIKGQGTIPNTFFDGIYYIANDSYAASITGGTVGTPETMADVVGDDIAVGAGMFSNPKGTEYDIFAPTEWGDSGTADSYFEGTDEQWYYLGDNGGGHAVGATHFPMRLVGNATGTNSFVQTRVTNINVGTRAQFDMSDANFDILELEQTTWINFGLITFPTVDASKFCNNTTFINCDQMITSTIDMDGNTWSGTTNANGAILLDTTGDSDNILNATFISDGTGHGVEISVLGTYDFDNWAFTGYGATTSTDAAVYVSAVTGTVTINVLNGGDTPTYRTAGATVVIVLAAVTVSVTAVEADGTPIEGAAVTLLAANGAGPLPFEDSVTITQTAGVATVAHTAHGLATGEKVGLKGATPTAYNGIKTITVTGANSYTYPIDSGTTSPATGTIISTGIVIDGLTNASGFISDTRPYSTAQAVTGDARKGSYSPVYKTAPISGTVSTTAGLPITVTMTPDQ